VRNDLSQIRKIVEEAFSTRSLEHLLQLLGFSGPLIAIDIADAQTFHAGARGTLTCYVIHTTSEIARIARALRNHNYTQLQLYLFIAADWSAITIASFGLAERLLTLTLDRHQLRASDLEALSELAPQNDEVGTALAARHARALDRSRITHRFFTDFAARRDSIAAAWAGPSAQQRRDRDQLALLLLSRLVFLYFLQHRGYLAGDRDYLVRRFRAWKASRRSFYTGVLKPLFFCALNRCVDQRPARATQFGDLPYLNGGLFERHVLERKHPRLDLPDDVMKSAFEDLLERYRFTARESSDAELDGVHDVGVDPEMLGGVFENLMAPRTRETTGTFYTPAATVDRLVCNTLDAYVLPLAGTARTLRDVKVLDPACGSGAFLLGALARIAERRAVYEPDDVMQIRHDVVARSLYGVDLQSDAALLCALRLWLALVPGSENHGVQPLPNLDRKIRQGDALVDPLDLRAGAFSSEVRRCIAELQPASAAYINSEPSDRPALQRSLHRSEKRLARAWVNAQQSRVAHRAAELRAQTFETDLFGASTSEARAARGELEIVGRHAMELRNVTRHMHTKDERPFFSFAVHFPDAALGGFDIVLCNPPWVRSHNWPKSLTSLVRGRFEVCGANTWHPPYDGAAAAGGGSQVDLALLFLERALGLLAPGGALGIILPAKFMRSLSGAAARKLLLEQAHIVSIEDHSLDQRSIFQADAFAALIVARKRDGSSSGSRVAIRTIRRKAAPLDYTLDQDALPLFEGDFRSPWLLAPPDVRRAIAHMREHPAIGSDPALRVRRGVVSGANAVMVLTRADPKLAGLCAIRSVGHASAASPTDFESIVEQAAVKPLVQGADVRAWACLRERFLICRAPDTPKNLPRLLRYLTRHNLDLTHVPKISAPSSIVAWHDLARRPEAVVLPADAVALNTVYYIRTDDDDAHLICAYLNSLPVRTMARAIAERAKDAHFRFFAWTISMLPLPWRWRSIEAYRLRAISRQAHDQGAIPQNQQRELDAIVARAYGLGRTDVRALQSFDAWLSGS
jgi:hypothetical protein